MSDRIYDISFNCGAGSYSIALCAANPELKAFIVDQKEVLARAVSLVASQNLQDQITLVEGSNSHFE